MSDSIQHECGIAFIRLRKPLDYYKQKYGSNLYGLKKLTLLMQKQHNRGQDGAGVGVVKLDVKPGNPFIFRERESGSDAIAKIFTQIESKIKESGNKEQLTDSEYVKENSPFVGEVYLGHLRYGTFGGSSSDLCHPFLRKNNWMTRNLLLAGNFNMTNVDELFDLLVELGQHPSEKADTITMLEKIGHFLDEENQRLFDEYKQLGLSNVAITEKISSTIDIQRMLTRAMREVDGGYVLAGIIGNGDTFILRDPAGIRPCFYYHDDEIIVATSERPAIQTGFNIQINAVKELQPGNALVVRKDGSISEIPILPALPKQPCSFERIYFSRGNDRDIYIERKKLGYQLSDAVVKELNGDLKNTVFSYIPNTAATAFYGLIDGIHKYLLDYKVNEITKLGANPDPEKIREILKLKPRREKIAVKDVKLRTFITDGEHREDMVAHVYDVTYGLVKNGEDTLVVIDDSIVRGTTLKTSILRILDRLHPKRIVIVSSAPQIRYPDCYGIDMSRLNEFVAFQAMLQLLKENNKEHLLQEVYAKCKQQEHAPKEEVVNHVKQLYDLFTDEQISNKIAEIIRPDDLRADLKVIFQTIDGLHQACPENHGDWYFSGIYPTPGGNKVVNRAFINFMEGNNSRAY
ncbi:MAG: amidophosphoribosyltransferase [Bacteroidia bacterium]|nr:amidophosphoribosyltransferase [Bacteroidia bacterium]MCC7533866.1 amidophosphoribosyltransferase [Bacteroidia bacterium]MCZ2140831.1 amidophosphoribosyltransferase [Bacteroidia bacterium]